MKHTHLFQLFGAFFMLTGVALGAMGAHAFKEILSPESLSSFEVGVRYQLIHALALLIIPTLPGPVKASIKGWVGCLIISGVFAFSGSIYLLSFKEYLGYPGIADFMWPLTPLGGLLLITAWALLFLSLLRKQCVD